MQKPHSQLHQAQQRYMHANVNTPTFLLYSNNADAQLANLH